MDGYLMTKRGVLSDDTKELSDDTRELADNTRDYLMTIHRYDILGPHNTLQKEACSVTVGTADIDQKC